MDFPKLAARHVGVSSASREVKVLVPRRSVADAVADKPFPFPYHRPLVEKSISNTILPSVADVKIAAPLKASPG